MNQIDKPEEYEKLSKEEREIIIKWIKEKIIPRKTPNKRHSSYGLKHRFEHDKGSGGFYMTNGQFKGAMLICGYKPLYEDDTNWIYCISKNSPGLSIPA